MLSQLQGRLAVAVVIAASLPAGAVEREAHVAWSSLHHAPRSLKARPTSSEARVVRVAPRDERTKLSAPIEIDVEGAQRVEVQRLDIDPPLRGSLTVHGSQVRFSPTARKPGRTYRVRVELADGGRPLSPIEWQHRALVPEPEVVADGRGAPLVLTFDDGTSDARETAALLATLAQYRARALFFPTGRWAAKHPGFIAKAKRAGHRICNHGYSHRNLTLPPITDVEIADEIRRGASDGTCRLFRPPGMAIDARVERIAREQGFEPYLWDVDSRDWEGWPAQDVRNRVLGQVRPGSVVLFHMHSDQTHRVLPKLLERLRNAGFAFASQSPDP